MVWEIVPWRPFRELERMRREMDRVWDTFFEERPRRRAGEVGEWLPSLDVSETKNEEELRIVYPFDSTSHAGPKR